MKKEKNAVHYYSKKLEASLFIFNEARKLYYFNGVNKNAVKISETVQLIENYDDENEDALSPYMSTSIMLLM